MWGIPPWSHIYALGVHIHQKISLIWICYMEGHLVLWCRDVWWTASDELYPVTPMERATLMLLRRRRRLVLRCRKLSQEPSGYYIDEIWVEIGWIRAFFWAFALTTSLPHGGSRRVERERNKIILKVFKRPNRFMRPEVVHELHVALGQGKRLTKLKNTCTKR